MFILFLHSHSLFSFISSTLCSLSTFLSLLPCLALRVSPSLSLRPSQVCNCHNNFLVCGQSSLLHILSGGPSPLPLSGASSHHSIKTAFLEVLSKVPMSNPMASPWTTCFSVSLNIAHPSDHHFLLAPLLPWCDSFLVPSTFLLSSQATFIALNLPSSSLRCILQRTSSSFSPPSRSLPQQDHQLPPLEIPTNLPLKALLSHRELVILSIVIACTLLFFLTRFGDCHWLLLKN